MSQERMFKDYQGRDIIIPPASIVEAGNEFLPLCTMCKKSRLTCENVYIREIEVPLEEGDNPDDEVVGKVRQPDGSYLTKGLGFKIVDGVEAGLIKTEEDMPMAFVCEWFERRRASFPDSLRFPFRRPQGDSNP